MLKGNRSRWLAGGGLLCLAVAMTWAASTHDIAHRIFVDGRDNTFNLKVAGAETSAWSLSSAEWHEGDDEPLSLPIGTLESGPELGVGDDLDITVAVKNASPHLHGAVKFSVLDPDPRDPGEAHPGTSLFVELFPALVFTLSEGENVLLDRVPATEAVGYVFPEPLAAGEVRVLNVRIGLADGVDGRWSKARTGVQISFEGGNAQ
jgi:hypothetical protein